MPGLGAILPLLLSVLGGTLAPKGMAALSGKAATAGGSLGKLAPLLAKGAGPAGIVASLLPFLPGLLSHGSNDEGSIQASDNEAQMSQLYKLVQEQNIKGDLTSTLENMGVRLSDLSGPGGLT